MMKLLYAPWRSTYTTDTAHTKNDNVSEKDCIFCQQFAQTEDEKYLILRRFEHNVVMLNLYPYNAGHLLLMPLRHHAHLNQMEQAARAELMELTMHAVDILTAVLGAHGVNTGFNFGKAAGAGIPSHLHMHALPRWVGDTNFLPALSQTKQISFDLHDLYKKLKPAFDNVK